VQVTGCTIMDTREPKLHTSAVKVTQKSKPLVMTGNVTE